MGLRTDPSDSKFVTFDMGGCTQPAPISMRYSYKEIGSWIWDVAYKHDGIRDFTVTGLDLSNPKLAFELVPVNSSGN